MKVEGNNNPSKPISISCDPIIKSITSDLSLLGNALMTRINDPLTILEFISFDSLNQKELKNKLKSLIDSFIDCDNDDDRLKFLLEMHYLLAIEEGKKATKFKSVNNSLEKLLDQAKAHQGLELKKLVSKFQVEVLKIVPGITEGDYKELKEELVQLDESFDLNDKINAVYEKINMHTQIPFDD